MSENMSAGHLGTPFGMLTSLKSDPGEIEQGGCFGYIANDGECVVSGACKTASQFVRGWPMT